MRLRIAQVGMGHGHAAGKWQALCTNPEVEALGPFETVEEALADSAVVAVAVETRNHESLTPAAAAVAAGKHLWFDKPAGDNWPAFQRLMADAQQRGLHVQMGYMFRYSPGFGRVAELARSAQLGDIFEVRAHMSTNIDMAERKRQSVHLGGILYDLSGHMLDQIVWLLGRPTRIHTVLHNEATPEAPAYSDNTVCVLDFPRAVAIVDIAAMEPRPTARRFEVYGTAGSAIVEPFDPARTLRLAQGEREELIQLPIVDRQELYNRELVSFVNVLRGEAQPDRPPAHELLVQETLLRATGRLTS